jgi:hypothetical protein
MQDLFKVIADLQINKPVKKHFVSIEGKEVEVTLEEKIEIIRNGESNYILKGGKPEKVEIKSDRRRFPEIENFTSDPFWPTESFIWKK